MTAATGDGRCFVNRAWLKAVCPSFFRVKISCIILQRATNELQFSFHLPNAKMDVCSFVQFNHKGRTPFLIGLLVGFTICNFVYFPTYFPTYLGERKPRPPSYANMSKRRTQQLELSATSVPGTVVGPTNPPGPVHPTPFNITDPLIGYVNVLKDKAPFKRYCSVCALVSTSGQVLNYTAGEEIDQAECVIRMNHAPVDGFEKHVGTRTTVRVATHTNFEEAWREITNLISTENRSSLIVWGPDRTMRTNGTGKTYNYLLSLAKLSTDVEIYMLTPERMTYSHKLFDNETSLPSRSGTEIWLSTGWFTMVLATEMCNRIKVYGMSNGDNCRDPNAYPAAYHYYDKGRGKECDEYNRMEKLKKATHRFFAEKKVFERWSKFHNITFHFPTWTPKA
ncbi:alpha-N-acetylgalactosaminide alpha-2,6-sialyltransferase 3-like [Branchiostoma floridae x Branchiostoma belcheri]